MARVLKSDTSLDTTVASRTREAGILTLLAPFEIGAGGFGLVVAIGLWTAGRTWGAAAGIGGVLLFLGLAHRMQRGASLTDAAMFQKGAEGEKKVAEALARGLPDEYLILHDVTVTARSQAQCDHLVLGPNGIFILETKAYSGHLTGGPADAKWIQTNEYKGKTTRRPLTNPVAQNQYHLEVFRELLKGKGYDLSDIRSIVVFTNPRVRLSVDAGSTVIVRTDEVAEKILAMSSSYTYDERYLLELLAKTGIWKVDK